MSGYVGVHDDFVSHSEKHECTTFSVGRSSYSRGEARLTGCSFSGRQWRCRSLGQAEEVRGRMKQCSKRNDRGRTTMGWVGRLLSYNKAHYFYLNKFKYLLTQLSPWSSPLSCVTTRFCTHTHPKTMCPLPPLSPLLKVSYKIKKVLSHIHFAFLN